MEPDVKTPDQIADEFVDTLTWPYSEQRTISATELADMLAAAIEADRAQLVGELPAARHAIDLTYDAADGDSNDSEIELLQAVRDNFQQIVEAVGGEWEHEPDPVHMDQEEWPHVTEEDDQ